MYVSKERKKEIIACMATAIARYEGWEHSENGDEVRRWVELAVKCYEVVERSLGIKSSQQPRSEDTEL